MKTKFTLFSIGTATLLASAAFASYTGFGIPATRAAFDADAVYSEDFEDAGSFAKFKVIDANGDAITWKWSEEGFNGKTANILYSSSGMDDWLLTPEFALEADKVYSVTCKVNGRGNYEEEMSIWYGAGEDYNKYTNVIPALIYQFHESHPVGNIVTSAAGSYHLGFHCTSKANQYGLFLDNIVVKEIANAGAPKEVGMLKVIPTTDGTLSVSISFFTPSKAANGTAVTSLTKVELYRDGELINTFDAPGVNKKMSFTDTKAVDGNHIYTVYAYNDKGKGLVATADAYVGEDIPDVPTSVKATESDDAINLKWNAPTKGANNYFFSGTDLKYNVYYLRAEKDTVLLKKEIAATSISINRIEGEQKTSKFLVAAISKAGEGKAAASNNIVVGAPYTLPVNETFASPSKRTHLWWYDDCDELYCTYSWSGYFWASGDDGEAYLYSGKINFKGSVNPSVSFEFTTLKNADKVTVEAVKKDGSVVVIAGFDGTEIVNDFATEVADLSAIKNENSVMIRFHIETASSGGVAIRNVIISDPTKKNLGASLTTPEKVYGGKPYSASVVVTNFGSEDAAGYKVQLFADGVKVGEADGTKTLSQMKKDTLTFSVTPSVNIEETKMYGVVTFDGDEYPDDNTSETVTISVEKPHSKSIDDLAAETQATGNVLTWTAPAVKSETVTEDFESYEPFYVAMDGIYLEPTYKVGEWTLTDKDQEYSIDIPNYNYNNEEEAFAYMVFNASKMNKDADDVTDPSTLKSLMAHSGNQYMASFTLKEDMAMFYDHSDDWLISPELNGDAQTISFWAKSLDSDYGLQVFEVLYSTTDTDVESFISLGYATAPGSWAQATRDLPAGAKYFAIHCVTPMDRMGIFMVDDVTFTKGDGVIKGYNIYRDGVKVGTADATATSFTDSEKEGDHTYNVTVIYDEGESCFSNDATATTNGIEHINAGNSIIERHNTAGQRVNASYKGVQIVKMSDGTTKKIIVK